MVRAVLSLNAMDVIQQIRSGMGKDWISAIYEEQIRPGRTRSFKMDIPESENAPAILHTLLGTELKVGRLRVHCPDLGTARYLLIFATLGCREVAVPYDITTIPAMADSLTTALDRTFEAFNALTGKESPQARGRMRSKLVRTLREEIKAIGAGEMMPLFNRSTKQRQN